MRHAHFINSPEDTSLAQCCNQILWYYYLASEYDSRELSAVTNISGNIKHIYQLKSVGLKCAELWLGQALQGTLLVSAELLTLLQTSWECNKGLYLKYMDYAYRL